MIRLAIVVFAVAAALAPLPAAWIEKHYSRGVYPGIQTVVTPATNYVPWALLDIAGLALLLAAVLWFRGRARSRGILRAVGAASIRTVVAAATAYLLFLGIWGLNYRRVPLHEKLDYSESRITTDAARRLALTAVDRINATHADATRNAASGPDLAAAFERAQRLLGQDWAAVPGVPKRSLLGFYFRRAAIDGMTNPFFLEVILNPAVLEFERPAVVVHEWAHLAGFASEAEANFVAWLTCMHGDAGAQYSGWLSLYWQVLSAVPRTERPEITGRLAEGPRQDLEAMDARYRAASPAVRAAARDVYDAYLRANRVDEGIASYGEVVQLILGTSFDHAWTPRPR